ncbi:MAG: FG-GAP repeat protein, partial [Anaerolineae bacterium]
MHKRRKLIGLLRAVLMLALAAGAGSPGAGAADFDRDGYADLAVGVPRENVGAVESAGVVHALYGSSTGLTATGDQLWDQDDLITSEGIEPWDLFGIALAAGDFDGNGAADLAIGVSEEDFGTYTEAGAVHVLYGGLPSGGLSARTSQLWHQNSPGVAGFVGTNEFFGAALAAGDFDGDGY